MLQSLSTERRSINIHNIKNTLHREYPFLDNNRFANFPEPANKATFSSCTTHIPYPISPCCYSMSRPADSISCVAFFIQLACTVFFLSHFQIHISSRNLAGRRRIMFMYLISKVVLANGNQAGLLIHLALFESFGIGAWKIVCWGGH